LNINDQANKISDNTQIYKYRLECILTSKSASIDQNAQAIHPRTTLHAIHQKIIEIIKLFQENQILGSSFLWSSAISNGIVIIARSIIQKYVKDSEYVASNKLSILVRMK